MGNLLEHARREIELAGLLDVVSDYNGELGRLVLDLVKTIDETAVSGATLNEALELFKTVASFRPLTPLGDILESGLYRDNSELSGDPKGTNLQSIRNPSVMSHDAGRTWFDIDQTTREQRANMEGSR